MDNDRKDDSKAKFGLAGVGLAAFALVCCAGAPLLIVGIAALGTGAVLGAGAAVLAAIALAWVGVLAVRARRRAARETTADEPSATDAAAGG